MDEETHLARQTARDFAREQLAPSAAARDRDGSWPQAELAALGELGMLGMNVSQDHGGSELAPAAYAAVIEELAKGCASTAVIVSVNNSLVCEPIERFGTESQKQAWLPKLATGAALGCFGLTEPSSGSDASHMHTVARQDGAGWRLSGAKNWITNGPHADVMVLLAATDPSAGAKGVTAFLVPLDATGVTRDPHDHKLGIHAAHSCTVAFDEVYVEENQRLGPLNGGFKIAMATLDGGRIGIASQALGIAVAAYECALAYAQTREAFGETLDKKQAIQFMLADMRTEIEATRGLLELAVTTKASGARYTREAAQAKLYASETATRCAHRAIQIHGGYGYSQEYLPERLYRDARITEIYEGTSEIMRIVIAAQCLKDAA